VKNDEQSEKSLMPMAMGLAIFLSVAALLAAIVGAGFAASALDEARSAGGDSSPVVKAVPVSLSELAIDPKVLEVETGGRLAVANKGKIDHSFAVDDTDLATSTLKPGEQATLDLSSLKAGAYTVRCTIPGHAPAGMTGQLHIGAASGGMAAMSAPSWPSPKMSADEMDALMAKPTKAFPAKTQGLGAQLLSPTTAPDGTLVFELTTARTKWEVEPGKFVEAMTYNGTVPGPTIKVPDGAKVRVVLHNQLDQSTSIHFHGLQIPNAMDGVPDITQAPVKPGQDFTYEFVAHGPAVGMYHSHQNAVEQVPDGLAGVFLIGDEPVPAGVKVASENVMMLNDSGTIGFSINGKSFPATAPLTAAKGEWIRVQYLNEGTVIHPMHLHGMDQIVIAKDGHPLATPSVEDTVTVAPGERFTVLVHATEPGVWAWHCHILPHAERSDGMFGMVTALVVS
jgi:FtsP/CotA-like multicopper oxidase with cupredoxin domain